MLKQIKYILAILFIMAVSLSCQKEDNIEGDIIKPFAYTLSNSNKYSKYDADIIAFFNGFTKTNNRQSLCIFDYGHFGCLVINSMDELREALICLSVEPPEIDFNRYTLLIGCCTTPLPAHFLARQTISVTPDKLILTITTGLPKADIYIPGGGRLFFWGLYPKFPDKDVEINLILKKESTKW